MKKASSEHPVASLAELLALAYQIEADAQQRYTDLAQQMETHNNTELVRVFSDLARAESKHAEEIRNMAGDIDLVALAERMGRWRKGGSPEEVDLSSAHYRMTPWHALQLALKGEQQALAFFAFVVGSATDEKIKTMAAEFVEEEAEHVDLVRRLLINNPRPADSWWMDDDPPMPQD